MRVLALVCFVVVVVCGRLCTVFYAGSPIPFHDQWTAEAHGMLLPYFRHELTFKSLFATHGDHVIAPTRAIALGLVVWEGKWDCISQMVVNCVISPFALLPLVYWTARQNRLPVASVFCLVVGIVAASPLFYGNIVWGFQSQILLMVALSIAHLYFLLVSPGDWARWGFAMLCGFLATISFGSGFLAPVVSAFALLSSHRRFQIGRTSLSATIIGCSGMVVLALWLAPAHPVMKDLRLATALHTFLHALAFPGRHFSYWGFFFWLPALGAFLLAATRREWTTKLIFPLGAAAWCLGQMLVISLGRSEVAPRYYDIFMVGVVANGCLAIELAKFSWVQRRARIVVKVGLALWLIAVGFKVVESTDDHTRGDVPVLAEQAAEQVKLLARYYAAGRSAEILRSSSFPVRPFPDVDYLDATLRQKEIESLWPSFIFNWRPNEQLRQLPWIGEGLTRENWFRSALLIGVAALVILYVIVLWAVLEKRSKPDDLQMRA